MTDRRSVLVTGCQGQVARSLAGLSDPDFSWVAVGRPDLDLCDPRSIAEVLARVAPVAVVNTAAFTAVDKAESEAEEAFRINRDGAGFIAAAAARLRIPIVHLSTDYVFSGEKEGPYLETDPVGPIGVYGLSKLEGERAVARANSDHVILRTAWVHSPFGTNFVKTMLRLAEGSDVVRVVADQRGTPTFAFDIADGIAAVLRRIFQAPDRSEWRGTFHLVDGGETTWAGLAEAIFDASRSLGGAAARVEPITTREYPTPARRPANSRLDTTRFQREFSYKPPPWQTSVERCVRLIRSS